MARHYIIGGERVRRRLIIKLTSVQRAAIGAGQRIVVEESVVWPISIGEPLFNEAVVDGDPSPGSLWGTGPYLKVPNRRRNREGEWTAVNRVFCPWGYPPDRIRLAHRSDYVALEKVYLAQRGAAAWVWILTLIPAPSPPSPNSDGMRRPIHQPRGER